MPRIRLRFLTLLGVATLLILLAPFIAHTASVQADGLTHSSVQFTVLATGLNNPRGLRFGPDGNLYVAEGGLGGTQSTTPAQCMQVPAPIGPYTGGFTSRISKISSSGHRTTVIDHLPSSQTSASSGGLTSGAADIQFVDGTLYGMEAGAGCSHGLLGTNNTIFQVNANGTLTTIASGLNFPISMTFDPGGESLYVSNNGFGVPVPDAGQIVRVDI